MLIECPNCKRTAYETASEDFEDLGVKTRLSHHQLKICRYCGILFDPKYCTKITKDTETNMGTGRVPETDTFTDTVTDTDTLATPHET